MRSHHRLPLACTPLAALLLWAAVAGAEPAWSKASPGGGGAFLAVDVSVTGTVMVGSDLSGIYRRAGTGGWTRIGKADGLGRTSIACLKWSPATGESALAGGRNGLFRSTNAGVTWQTAAGPPGFQGDFFSALGWSRSHGTTVYVAGAASSADTTVLLWRSLDGGGTWTAVANDLPASEALRALKLVVHPFDPNTLYLVTGPDGSIAPKVVTPRRALYKSTNGGANWTLKSGADEVLDVAVHHSLPGTLLMTTSSGTDNTGLLKRSVDGGDSWSTVLTNTGAVWWDQWNAYLVNIGLDACSPIPANAGRFRSTDGGLTWSRIDTGSTWETGWSDCPHARGIPQTGVANALSAKGEYWVTSQFVWRYSGTKYASAFTNEVGSGRWITSGIENAVPVCIADAHTPGTLFTGYYDLGLWRTADNGQSWKSVNPPLPGWNGVGGNASSVVADSARPGVVWAAIGESSKAPYLFGIYRSTNFGDAWTQVSTGLPSPAFLYGLSMDRQSPVANRKLWVTANGALYVSTNDGTTWQPASTAGGLPTTGLFVTEVDRRNGNTVFAGGWSGLFRSTDGGASWTKLSAGFDHSAIPGEIGAQNTTVHRVKWHGPHQILSDPYTPNKVWVTSYMEDTTEIASLHRGLYVSPDNGTSWSEVRRRPFARGIAIDSLGRRAMLTSSPATTSGSNSNEMNASAGLEHGRSADGLTWTWSPDPAHPDIRYPFGWAVYAGGTGHRWVAVPGYGFMRRPNAPIAVNDAFVVGGNSSGNILPVLANDSDPDVGDSLTLVALSVRGMQGVANLAGGAVSYTPPAGFTGVDQFGYIVRDLAGATGTATVAVNVVEVPGDTLDIPIAAGPDDAEESAAGVMNVGSSDLEMTFDTSLQTIGLRFVQVAVPQGAPISAAWLQFRVDETTSEPTALTIRGQAIDDAPTFTSASGNISSRALTTASVPWSPAPWLVLGAAGPDQRTPDLSAVISEIVSRPGWASGQSLALILTGSGKRVAEAWDVNPAGAAILHLEYGGGGIPVGVEEPRTPGFALHGVHPTPSRGALRVELSLPDRRPARLELMDVAGRRVAARDVGTLGVGRHRVELATGLRAGIYLVRLTREGQARTRKAVVLD